MSVAVGKGQSLDQALQQQLGGGDWLRSRSRNWRRDDHDWRAGSQPQTHYPAPTQHWSAPSTPSSQGQGRLSMTPTI